MSFLFIHKLNNSCTESGFFAAKTLNLDYILYRYLIFTSIAELPFIKCIKNEMMEHSVFGFFALPTPFAGTGARNRIGSLLLDHLIKFELTNQRIVPKCSSDRVVYFTGTPQFQYRKENRESANHSCCSSKSCAVIG